MSQLSDHLDFLYGEDSGYVYSPIKRKNGEWIQRWFTWPADRLSLSNWILTEKLENDVYLSPVIFKEKKVSKEAIDHSNVVWIEFDGNKKLEWDKGIPEPDVIIQTSTQHHMHCYWKIDPLGADAVEEINRRITYFLEADSSGWDSTQVLRPPSTVNYKHTLPVETIRFEPGLHSSAAFDIAPVIEKPIEIFQYDTLLDVKQIIIDNKLDGSLINRIMNEIVLHPHRSEFLMHTGHLLAEADLDPLEIVSCLYHIDARIKKFVGREDQLRRLSEIASIATFKVERELYISVYSPNDIINHTLELEFLILGYLHSTGLMIITGAPGVGKTQWCFDLAYRLSTGDAVLDKPAYKPVKVAFLSLEMDITELKYIFKAQTNSFEKQGMWNENCYIISPDIDTGLSSFEKTLAELAPQVLIIDSISELATEDLNETEARTIMRWLKKIRKKHNVAIVAIHHNRKASDANKKPKKLSDLYGSYLFGKNTETVISMWQEEGRELLEFDVLKARFAKLKSYRLRRSENLTFKTEAEISVTITAAPTEPAKTVLNFS